MRITEYVDASDKSPFAGWFNELDAQAAAKVTVALVRIGQGNFSNARAWEMELSSIGSISALATASISAGKEMKL